MSIECTGVDCIVPTVSLTAPTAGNVSGAVTAANASDNAAVARCRFQVDGVASVQNIGALQLFLGLYCDRKWQPYHLSRGA